MADAGSFGGGIVLYLAVSSSADSRDLDVLLRRFLLSFRRIDEAEKVGSASLGDNFSSTLVFDEKLGARGPEGRRWVSLENSPLYFGCMKLTKSPPVLGRDEDMNGEILRGPGPAMSKEKGMLELEPIADAKWSKSPRKTW